MRLRPHPGGRRSPGLLLLTAVLLGASVRPARGYTLIRNTGFTDPPAAWSVASLPLPMLISSAGSDDVPGSADTDAIIAGQQAWNSLNTSFFVFAAPTVGTGTALNSGDGKNSIFFDETGAIFGAGSSVIAFTSLAFTISTGIVSDADLVFNGYENGAPDPPDMIYSTATPTPATAFDIQAIATHELGHVQGLDHSGIISAVMFPIGAQGLQFQRNLDSDDRLGVSATYPEAAGGAGITGLQLGDGDLAAATGSIEGFVRTSSGLAVPGTHVVALDGNGLAVVGDVGRFDGSFRLTGLLPGSYQVYAEPMDGLLYEDFLGQGAFMNAFLPFTTTFLGGNPSPSTVVVSAGSASTGHVVSLGPLYAAEAEANNSSAAANPVVLEGLTSGLVNPVGDVDYFSFPGTTGDIVSLDVDASGDGCPLDPVLTLYSTNGTTQLATNDDFPGKVVDSRIAFRLAATGTFFARVTDFGTAAACPNDGPGSFYTLHVNKALAETEGNDTIATANPAVIGQRRGGIILSGDTDYYSFSAKFADRILAEVTANRSGSLLNPTLTLFTAGGAQLAVSTDIGAPGNLDSLIDFTFLPGPSIPSLPATFYLRVTAASGAGTNSFYVLHLGTDRLNTNYSGLAPVGAGLDGLSTADIFPKFVTQGNSFDLIVAGEGIPLDPANTITISGPGISTFPTAGPDFGGNGGGIDFMATSVTTVGAAPGPHTIFTQNATLKSALSGGLVIQPSGVPPEAGPMIWESGQLSFPAGAGATAWNVYRGNLPLVDLDLNGLADNYGAALACARTSPLAADPSVPPPGGGYYYLVAARNLSGEGTLGQARQNGGGLLERPKAALTPACP